MTRPLKSLLRLSLAKGQLYDIAAHIFDLNPGNGLHLPEGHRVEALALKRTGGEDYTHLCGWECDNRRTWTHTWSP
jgi:hypothetical protein